MPPCPCVSLGSAGRASIAPAPAAASGRERHAVEGGSDRSERGLLAVLALLTCAAGGLLFNSPTLVAAYAVCVTGLGWIALHEMR